MNEYKDFGPLWDDDHENLLGGYFAPNGDYYLTMQHVDQDTGRKGIPLSFRISLSGGHIGCTSVKLRNQLIDLIKNLPTDKINEKY